MQRVWKSILQAEEPYMVTPCCRVSLAHHQNVFNNLVDSSVRAGPDGVEECEGSNMNLAFSWELTRQEVERRSWRCRAQLEKTSKGLVLEDFYCFQVWRAERKCLQA